MDARSHTRAGAFLLAAIAGPEAGRLSAQVADSTSRDSAVELAPIDVRSSIVPSAGAGVGSGVPARISIIGRSRIDAWQPRLMADLLGASAGVSLYDDLGTPYKLNLSTRGFSAGPTVGLPPGVSVFLDGVRQNEPDASEVNFDLLPMAHVERIELLSGTASLLGPNSLGGAVNLVTRRGRGPLSAELETSGGSFGSWSAAGTVTGSADGGWDFYAGGGYDTHEGWREATGARRYNLFGSAGRQTVQRGIRLQLLAARSRAETAGSLPESIFHDAPRTNFTAGDFENLNAQQLILSGFTRTGRGLASFTAFGRRSDAERYNVNQAPDDNVRSFTRNYGAGATADWRVTTATGPGVLSFRIGADGSIKRARVRLFEEAATDPSDQTLNTEVESPGWDGAAFILTDYRVGRATFFAGVRGDHVVIPFRDRLDPAEDTTSTFSRLSPRAGINLDIGRGASVYGSFGQAFRAPVVLELACADPEAACPLPFALGDDPPLDPVIATTVEAGGRWTRGGFELTGSAYRTAVKNEIAFVASDVARLAGYFTNLDRTRREGIEIAARMEPAPWLSTWANYAWTRATYQSQAELFSIRGEDEFEGHPLAGANTVAPGDRLPLVPEHQVRVGGSAELPGGASAGIDARYTGRQWLRGDEANDTAPLDGHFTANLRLGWEFGRWELAGIVSNVFGGDSPIFGTFNENRRTGELERFLTPMHARSIEVSVRRRFGG